MQIRQAKSEELARIMDIYAYARGFMAQNGNPRQWGTSNWPPEALIREDIQTGHCYVCVENDRIVGVFFYAVGYRFDPMYDMIEEGSWKGGDNYGVVHRIASDGSVKGVGKFCIGWAYEQCGHLRMDTHTDNKIMQKLLTSLGFEYCGIVYAPVEDDPRRLAYEKQEKSNQS